MAPRRKPTAPTYSQLFGDGSGASSSGPSSSDAVPDSQTSQRVSWSPSPPLQMPPPPPPAAASQPAPVALTEGFGDNNCVSRSVSAMIKGYYDGAYPNWSVTPNHVKITWFKCFALEKTGVVPSLSELFKMAHATSDGVFMDPASEKRFHAVAPKKKGRIVGIGSVNEVERTTSSYTSRRDEKTSQMKARMDSQQVRLDSLEDLLDVMAVENPTMQRMLSERRAALGLPSRNPEESNPNCQQQSNLTDYFDNM
uniref:Uncharacterized protein n=1 Tax=Brassica oleracea var. oleracea TaxID=109376 RepID=A0A0D3A3K1_BRAOL